MTQHKPITLLPDGFVIGGMHIRWLDVAQVKTFKLGLFTVDEIRVVFVFATGAVVEVSEEQPGFDDLMRVAVAEFPSMRDWRSRIVAPAFACNETVLFQRPG